MEDVKFSTGAVRSADANGLDFMSISPIAMIALAKTCAEGATKYGAHNYELGMDTIDVLNHVKRHLTMWEAGDRSEPHLPHAFWGLMAAIHMDTLRPELSDGRRRGKGCSVTPEMRSALDAGKADRDARRKAGAFASIGGWCLDQVAEVRAILGLPGKSHPGRPPEPDDPATLRGRLQEAFQEHRLTDDDIREAAIDEEDAPSPAFRPRFEQLGR